MISGFQAIFVPAFSADGLVLDFPAQEWSATADEVRGIMRFSCRGHQIEKQLQDVLALDIQGTEETTDIKRTVGRMALTGIGANLFTKMNGVGAGLLDLSFRGTIQKGIVSGAVVFTDLTCARFRLQDSQLELLAQHLPKDCIADEVLQGAVELENLFTRMKADGFSVLEELAAEVVESSQTAAAIKDATSSGKTFAERDATRRHLEEENIKLGRVRSLFFALLYANKMSLSRFIEQTKERCPQFSALNIPDGIRTNVSVLSREYSDPHVESNINASPDLASAVMAKWSFFESTYRDFKDGAQTPIQKKLVIPKTIAFMVFIPVAIIFFVLGIGVVIFHDILGWI